MMEDANHQQLSHTPTKNGQAMEEQPPNSGAKTPPRSTNDTESQSPHFTPVLSKEKAKKFLKAFGNQRKLVQEHLEQQKQKQLNPVDKTPSPKKQVRPTPPNSLKKKSLTPSEKAQETIYQIEALKKSRSELGPPVICSTFNQYMIHHITADKPAVTKESAKPVELVEIVPITNTLGSLDAIKVYDKVDVCGPSPEKSSTILKSPSTPPLKMTTEQNRPDLPKELPAAFDLKAVKRLAKDKKRRREKKDEKQRSAKRRKDDKTISSLTQPSPQKRRSSSSAHTRTTPPTANNSSVILKFTTTLPIISFAAKPQSQSASKRKTSKSNEKSNDKSKDLSKSNENNKDRSKSNENQKVRQSKSKKREKKLPTDRKDRVDKKNKKSKTDKLKSKIKDKKEQTKKLKKSKKSSRGSSSSSLLTQNVPITIDDSENDAIAAIPMPGNDQARNDLLVAKGSPDTDEYSSNWEDDLLNLNGSTTLETIPLQLNFPKQNRSIVIGDNPVADTQNVDEKSSENDAEKLVNVEEKTQSVEDKPKNIDEKLQNVVEKPQDVGEKPQNIEEKPQNIDEVVKVPKNIDPITQQAIVEENAKPSVRKRIVKRSIEPIENIYDEYEQFIMSCLPTSPTTPPIPAVPTTPPLPPLPTTLLLQRPSPPKEELDVLPEDDQIIKEVEEAPIVEEVVPIISIETPITNQLNESFTSNDGQDILEDLKKALEQKLHEIDEIDENDRQKDDLEISARLSDDTDSSSSSTSSSSSSSTSTSSSSSSSSSDTSTSSALTKRRKKLQKKIDKKKLIEENRLQLGDSDEDSELLSQVEQLKQHLLQKQQAKNFAVVDWEKSTSSVYSGTTLLEGSLKIKSEVDSEVTKVKTESGQTDEINNKPIDLEYVSNQIASSGNRTENLFDICNNSREKSPVKENKYIPAAQSTPLTTKSKPLNTEIKDNVDYVSLHIKSEKSIKIEPPPSPPDSPKRVSLDDRISRQLQAASYEPPIQQNSSDMYNKIPVIGSSSTQEDNNFFYQQQLLHHQQQQKNQSQHQRSFSNLIEIQQIDTSSCRKPFVLQKGNVLEIVPTSTIPPPLPSVVQHHKPHSNSNLLTIVTTVSIPTSSSQLSSSTSVTVDQLSSAEAMEQRKTKKIDLKLKRKQERDKRRLEKFMRKEKIKLEIKHLMEIDSQVFDAKKILDVGKKAIYNRFAVCGRSILRGSGLKTTKVGSTGKKNVMFGDGIAPGDGTSTSADEQNTPLPLRDRNKRMIKKKFHSKRRRFHDNRNTAATTDKDLNDSNVVGSSSTSALPGETFLRTDPIIDIKPFIDPELENMPPPPRPPGSPPPHLAQPKLRLVDETIPKLIYFHYNSNEHSMYVSPYATPIHVAQPSNSNLTPIHSNPLLNNMSPSNSPNVFLQQKQDRLAAVTKTTPKVCFVQPPQTPLCEPPTLPASAMPIMPGPTQSPLYRYPSLPLMPNRPPSPTTPYPSDLGRVSTPPQSAPLYQQTYPVHYHHHHHHHHQLQPPPPPINPYPIPHPNIRRLNNRFHSQSPPQIIPENRSTIYNNSVAPRHYNNNGSSTNQQRMPPLLPLPPMMPTNPRLVHHNSSVSVPSLLSNPPPAPTRHHFNHFSPHIGFSQPPPTHHQPHGNNTL